MLKGIDIKEIIEFVSPSDTGDNPTKFYIGNISAREKIGVFSDAIDKEGNIDLSKMQSKSVDIFKAGIKEIKNLNGVDYKEITEDVANCVPFAVLIEVVGKIIEYNFTTGQETKN
jgi:hypothetical protein